MIFSNRIILKLTTDFIVILVPACLAAFLKFFVEPFQRGFFCNDNSIRYPYKQNTIPGTQMDICGIIGAIFLIIIVETKFQKTSDMTPAKNLKIFNWTLTPYVQNLYNYISLFLFAEAVERFMEEAIKIMIGKLRPHFMDLCMPILLDGTTCDDPQNLNRYIQDFTCSNVNATVNAITNARKSFPSGHTSFSSVTAFFCVFYLESRMKFRGSTKMLKRFLQLSLITGVIYIASSRISDYRHFASDVCAGFFIGFSIAYLICFYVSSMFRKNIVKESNTSV